MGVGYALSACLVLFNSTDGLRISVSSISHSALVCTISACQICISFSSSSLKVVSLFALEEYPLCRTASIENDIIPFYSE